ncbi:MAG: hypothetical protein JW818_06140 [Pirellulales bacterium]|nr:hypothetical protein [Pirellulales bacterium]
MDLVNDPLRTVGWQGTVIELPNDKKTFNFQINKQDDVQHLIDVFAKIKSQRLTIRLGAKGSPPDRSSKGDTRTLRIDFSIGDQKAVDAWFERLPEVEPGVRKIRRERLKEPYPACPPTLTIYVINKHDLLNHLVIPLHVKLDTAHGLKEGKKSYWQRDKKTKEWTPPPKEVVDFIQRHRQQQANLRQQKAELPAPNTRAVAPLPEKQNSSSGS